jgi:hypothetical protein
MRSVVPVLAGDRLRDNDQKDEDNAKHVVEPTG